MRCTIPLLVGAVALAGCDISETFAVSRSTNFVTLPHASLHVNPDRDFNEFNPGIGVGSEAPFRRSDYVFGLEAGRFRNSLEEGTSYAAAYVERKFAPVRSTSIGLGAFFAYAEYPNEVQRAEDNGFITFGDFVPVAGLQATVPTIGSHEFRVRLTPGLEDADALLTLQSNFRF